MQRLHLGFTGTQRGMSASQKSELVLLLSNLNSKAQAINHELVFHHGLCVGSDAEAHEIARLLGIKIVGHPPIIQTKMAILDGFWEIREPRAYLVRNRMIVKESKSMIATPFQAKEVLRSGTWATVRETKRQGKRVVVILRNGRLLGG